ncbi:MAG TPA: hypothetical protein VF712_18945 [Thermoleophilaceae bacterium]|jgi:hypothetical protein
MRISRRQLAGTGAIALVAASAAGGGAGAQDRFEQSDRETRLLSRAAGGGFPNGASRNPAISQDRQLARAAAYESDASDIVKGDSNGVTDVFVVHRKRPYSLNGEPWRAAATVLASRSSGGAAANGASTNPDISGDREHAPRCVAFLSDATNLVKGDTNRRRDAFVHDLATRRTTRVSLTRSGRQSSGTASEVRIDGGCTRVAFVSDASGRRQVYLRDLRKGTTTLVSRSRGGRAGNADSYDIALSKRRSGGGPADAVAFTSESTNLHSADRTGTRDVYVRRGGSLLLASVTAKGRPGNGHSDQPALSDGGKYVAFRTEATDVLKGDRNPGSDVVRALVGRPGTARWVSKSQAVNQPGDAPSANPAMGAPGSPVIFESLASNLQSTVSSSFADRNQSGDVFYWNHVSFNVSLQSRDSDNEIPNVPQRSSFGHVAHAPALDPATSSLGNYMLFDAAYPLMDLPVAASDLPQYAGQPRAAATASHERPELRQVYLRYIGRR